MHEACDENHRIMGFWGDGPGSWSWRRRTGVVFFFFLHFAMGWLWRVCSHEPGKEEGSHASL
jgi:hypothetical protein